MDYVLLRGGLVVSKIKGKPKTDGSGKKKRLQEHDLLKEGRNLKGNWKGDAQKIRLRVSATNNWSHRSLRKKKRRRKREATVVAAL